MAATRRAILCGIAAAPVAAAAAFPIEPTPDRTEWDRLCATFREARAEQTRLAVLEDDLSFQWNWSERAPEQPNLGPLDKSLSLNELVAQCQTPEWEAQWVAYKAAHANWTAREKAAKAAFMGDVEDRYSNALDAETEALCAVKAYPVSTLAMLAEKGALLVEAYDGNLEGGEAEILIADIRRLAAQEGR
jgi:hypothetical protein